MQLILAENRADIGSHRRSQTIGYDVRVIKPQTGWLRNE